ncbi:MAG: hypothetical protein E7Z69_08320 [Thermoplasmata archaeon]|nr:hypothetical protein [Thermoplasmata archaeon]
MANEKKQLTATGLSWIEFYRKLADSFYGFKDNRDEFDKRIVAAIKSTKSGLRNPPTKFSPFSALSYINRQIKIEAKT